MEKEYLAAIWGAAAGGLVSLAIEGVKGWMNRRKAVVTASISIASGGGRIPHYAFTITIVNVGGQTLHIVRYGIKGPSRSNAKQQQKKREIRNMRQQIAGWRAWIQRVDLFEPGIMARDEVIELPPGKPHSKRDETVHDWIGLELNQQAIAFAEDSFGRKYTCRFNVPTYSTLVGIRTPAEQEQAQQLVHPWLRVDREGNRLQSDPLERSDPNCSKDDERE